MNSKKVFCSLVVLVGFVQCHGGGHLMSETFLLAPQSLNSNISFNSRQDGGPLGTGLAGEPPIPPPQNNPVNPLGPGVGPGGLPDGFVPFGLNHIILIVVPKFTAKFHKLPKWLSSTIKISMPITVFFDQLTVPPGMFVPGLGIPSIPLPLPLGPPPPIGLRPPGHVLPVSPVNPAVPLNNVGAPGMAHSQTSLDHLYPPTIYNYEGDSYHTNSEVDMEDEAEDEEGYESSYAEKRRGDQSVFAKQILVKSRKKRAISFNETIHSAERAALIPKLENLLENAGFGGKPCLLRTICEVHEASLKHYGLLGELFTMFFSVSRSVFAESHLPEYLRAEEAGKLGKCTEYFRHCDNTIFSWEEVKYTKKKREPFIVNVIDEVL